jgi:SnoaL-like domain
VGQEPFQFNGAPTHFMTNHVVDLTGDQASSRSYFNDVDLLSGLMIGTGIYTCSHVRSPTGWKISSMRLEQRLCDSVLDSISAQRSGQDAADL